MEKVVREMDLQGLVLSGAIGSERNGFDGGTNSWHQA